ncbi:hypothetical protein BTM25_33790 [Actinomadura rubteroloni]|uniref:Integral membrane protein n=1 Tax=Actinomadura rubteroloni TaxID=1926885 RepID=A0A2P4UI59_9ACTN|nr:hypothetical protein [Actinomadura rubteroloni]POM24744.1 hypothetical protein BTM25_33790 [Actinomadura rubteroloni]
MSQRPALAHAAAALEAVEGLTATGIGVFVGVETAVGSPVDPVSAVGVTVLALIGGVAMLAVARGILLGDARSRAPGVLTQLFALPVAWSLWQSGRPEIALPLGAVALAALVALLSPANTAWLAREADDDREPAGTDS